MKMVAALAVEEMSITVHGTPVSYPELPVVHMHMYMVIVYTWELLATGCIPVLW